MWKQILRFLKIYFLFLFVYIGLTWFIKLVFKPAWLLHYLRTAPVNLVILEGYGIPFLLALLYFFLRRPSKK